MWRVGIEPTSSFIGDKVKYKLKEKNELVGDWTHNLLYLNEKWEEKKKWNIMGLMGIELGSPKSEKWNYQV